MARRDLTDRQLMDLERWSRLQDPERAEQVQAVISEVRALRDRESSTRFLLAIEGEI